MAQVRPIVIYTGEFSVVNTGDTVDVTWGGTGASTPVSARLNLGATTHSFGTSPHASPNIGDMWTDTVTGITYSYYFDGDSNQWVELGPSPLTGLPVPDLSEEFETVNRNLKSFPFTISYDGDGLVVMMVYTLPASESITKTFHYMDSRLTAITLSGDVPSGIQLTKTYNYTDELITSVGYSS